MFKILFFLFIVIPIIEIAVLMQVGAMLGVWPTIAIVIITAWLGAKNVKQQGMATVQSLQNKMAMGEMPSEDIVAGLLLLVAGVLLVTPGFVTDIFGLSLLIPQFRTLLIGAVQRHLTVSSIGAGQGFAFHHHTVYGQPEERSVKPDSVTNKEPSIGTQPHRGQTIDGEYERKD
ncbi:FxsA family protein [Thalassotalea sp. G2M2-11]|uniref:FxsA family protein n=1 Tax=Thalassotalea sp. G2M2-11 TaxID=2787627 RepID=UPI0019D04590|nr:FxsA family protein [Thalassotalea sp. G2M2-11]